MSTPPDSLAHSDEVVIGAQKDGNALERLHERGYNYCLRRLTGAPCTEHELRSGLGRKGYPEQVIDAVLHDVRAAGLVDDRLYAELWVDSRTRSRSLTAPVLRAELRRKGVDDELIAAALHRIDPDQERVRAHDVVRRKIRGPIPSDRLERDKLVRRLVGVLARKGHAAGSAFSIVSAVLDDLEHESSY